MSQFPQPTRPVPSYDDLTPIPMQIHQASQNVDMGNFNSESWIPEQAIQFDFPQNSMPQTTAATKEEEEKQAIEDLIRVIFEWYEKLPESIRSQINLEKFNISSNNVNVGEQRFNVESTTICGRSTKQLKEFKHQLERIKMWSTDINTSRGVNAAGEELRQKLERFKIRTVRLGEVAEENEEVKR